MLIKKEIEEDSNICSRRSATEKKDTRFPFCKKNMGGGDIFAPWVKPKNPFTFLDFEGHYAQ